MSLKSASDTVVTRLAELASSSDDIEKVAYAGSAIEKISKIDFGDDLGENVFDIGIPGTTGFGVAAIQDEFLPTGYLKFSGHDDIMSPNYALVVDAQGSVFENITPFYYKMTENVISISLVAQTGYVLPRAFYDSPNGFLHFKYLAGNVGGKLVSKQFLDPVSTNSSHNTIGDLISSPDNNYAGFIDACRDAGYKTTTIFEWEVLRLISLAQSQSGASTALCAFNDVAPFFPKGCLSSALHDTNDVSVTFTGSGYSDCGLTGSGSNFAKTTHNGQNCGISDVTGNMWKIVTGLTYLAKTGATCSTDSTAVSMTAHGLAVDDVIYFGGTPSSGSTYNTSAYTVTGVTDGDNFTVNNVLERDIVSTDGVYSPRYFRILKTSVRADSLTSSNLLDESNYDLLDLTGIVNSNSGSTYFGNDSNTVLNFSTDTNSKEYKMASCCIPTSDGTSSDGTTTFGNDYMYRYLRHGLVPIVGGNWNNSSDAGVFALNLNYYSSTSNTTVGGFASVSL